MNLVIGVLECQAESIRADSECEYVLSDVRVHPIPFWSRKSNFKISERLTVYVSFGGPKFRAQELGSRRTVAGAARCNPQVLGSTPVQGGLE